LSIFDGGIALPRVVTPALMVGAVTAPAAAATTAALTASAPQHPGEFAAFLTIRTVQGVMLSPWAPT